MDDCIFCKIANHEIPSHIVYEDNKFIAFLDINPVSKGHTLLIPKQHYRWVYEVKNFDQYWLTAQKIALSIKKSPLQPEFISFLTIGNEIPHAHIQIIPRRLNDPIAPILSSIPHLKLSDNELDIISQSIKL